MLLCAIKSIRNRGDIWRKHWQHTPQVTRSSQVAWQSHEFYEQVKWKQESWAIAKTTARCAQYLGALKSFQSPHYTHPTTFPEICNGLLFRSILRMCVQNLKVVASPIPEIIGVLKKFGQSLDTLTLPFSKILTGFYSDGPCENRMYPCQVWSL